MSELALEPGVDALSKVGQATTRQATAAYLHPQAAAQAHAALPDEDCIEQATTFLKLLGDPTRLKILSALSTAKLCVCDLSAVVGISESAISHQLRLLRAGRLVAGQKAGRTVYYRLADEHVTALIHAALEHAREG